MLSCCKESPYKEKLCRPCWRAKKEMQYHCTWPNCIRPVFALTLCRSHYRQINVECVHPNCHRPSYCRQVCAHHYRKKEFLPIVQCSECTRPMYMDQKCFYHFTYRSCLQCKGTVFFRNNCVINITCANTDFSVWLSRALQSITIPGQMPVTWCQKSSTRVRKPNLLWNTRSFHKSWTNLNRHFSES